MLNLRQVVTLGVRLLWGSATLWAIALLLTGCSSTAVIDLLPASMGGLPATAKTRPAEPAPYMPVDALPPPRDTPPLDDEKRKKLEDELTAVRDRQAASAAVATGNGDQSGAPAPAASAPAPATKRGKDAAKPTKKKPAQTSSN
jgi:hypothetical protein